MQLTGSCACVSDVKIAGMVQLAPGLDTASPRQNRPAERLECD